MSDRIITNELSDRESKIIDYDIAYMNEQYEQARQHESQRAQMTAIVLGLSGVILTLIFTKPSPELLIFGGLVIIAIGIFGSRFSLKHYERFKHHIAVARQIRYGIEERLGHQPKYREIAVNSRLVGHETVGEFNKRIRPYDKKLYRAYKKRLFAYWLEINRGQIIVGCLLVMSGIFWWMIIAYPNQTI